VFKVLRDTCILLYALSLSMPITFLWVLLIAGITTSVVLAIVENRSLRAYVRDVQELLFAPLSPAIGAYALAVTVSGLFTGGVPEAFKSFVSLRGFVVYFWAYGAFRRAKWLKNGSVTCMLLLGSLAGFLAAFQQLTDFHPTAFRYLQGTGFLATPMTLSGVMQLLSLLAIGLLFGGAYRDARGFLSSPYFMTFALPGTLSGIIFASERSGWLGFVAGLIVSAASVQNRRRLANVAACVATLAIVAWLTIPVVKARIGGGDITHDPSFTFRMLVWDHALKVFYAHPLFGIGIRHFPIFPVPAVLVPMHAPVLDHAHSNYIHVLATLGLFGMACYLYMLWRIIMTAWSGFQISGEGVHFHSPASMASAETAIDPDEEPLSIINDDAEEDSTRASHPWTFEEGLSFGIMAGAIALMVSGLFEYNFGTGQIRLTQWFLLAMLAGQKREGRSPVSSERRNLTQPRESLPASIVTNSSR
jgi:O-antigen ligase